MADDAGGFPDVFADDPVIQAVKRDVARRAQDATEQQQAEHDADMTEKFRGALLEEFDAELLELSEKTISKETKAAYAGDIQRFQKWCRRYAVTPLPSAPEVASVFLWEMLHSGASYQAVKRAHAALSYWHQLENVADPVSAPAPADADGEPFAPAWKLFPKAVLRRAHKMWLEGKENENGVVS